jgi:hypothetical protein
LASRSWTPFGYRVLILGGCDISEPIVAEGEAFHFTMRLWQAQGDTEEKSKRNQRA